MGVDVRCPMGESVRRPIGAGGRCCAWWPISGCARCVNYNIVFIDGRSLHTEEEEERSNRKQNRVYIYIPDTHTHTFTSGTRWSTSSPAWSSSAAVKSRRAGPPQWGGNLGTAEESHLRIHLHNRLQHTAHYEPCLRRDHQRCSYHQYL